LIRVYHQLLLKFENNKKSQKSIKFMDPNDRNLTITKIAIVVFIVTGIVLYIIATY